MSFNAIDLSALPAPDIIETLDFEIILAAMLTDLQARDASFSALVESDPAYKILEVAAYREMLLRARINSAAKAVMLPYATGSDLDVLGSLFRTSRHEVTPEDTSTLPPTAAVMETDDDYRRRIYLAPEGLTNAGTEGSYLYHALNASPEIKDASAHSPVAGEVVISLLSREGSGVASAELINTVNAYLQQSTIRQLTDQVTVQSVEVIEYTIDATLYLQSGPSAVLVKEQVNAEVNRYVETTHQVGAWVPLSGLYRALQQEGVLAVELLSPQTDLQPTSSQVAYCTAISLQEVIA